MCRSSSYYVRLSSLEMQIGNGESLCPDCGACLSHWAAAPQAWHNTLFNTFNYYGVTEAQMLQTESYGALGSF